MLPFGVLSVRRQKILFIRDFLLYGSFFDSMENESGAALTKSYKWSPALLIHIYASHLTWGIYI